ncbi:MAG: TonB-dependent receptor plug domain-containing protein, partial [Myxococcota bacterium]
MMAALVTVALSAPAPECVVRGQVVDAYTGEQLSRVGVSADRQSTTSVDGRFEISVPCEASVVLVLERLDYQTAKRSIVGDSTLNVALEPLSVERIDDVIVQASIPVGRAGGSTITLDSDALERSRGQGLAESLAQVPGVATLRSGGGSKPIIRGQQGRRVLIVFDGVRHESQKWGLDHAPEVDPFAAGTIRVVKGASGVRFGPDAIGGVVEMLPHPFEDAGFHGAAHQVAESNGRQGTLALRLDSVDQVADGLAFRVDGNVQKRAALSTPDYPLDNTGGATWNLGTAAQWRTRDWEFTLRVRRHRFENGIF